MSNALEESCGLPELAPDSAFTFACGPDSPCFNACCSELRLPITPYDMLRLRLNLGIPSATVAKNFLETNFIENTGLPLPLLKMIPLPGEPCPFRTPVGCSVYEDRPSACRAYPLGRGTRLENYGVRERFFIVKEDYCLGFDAKKTYTPLSWLKTQGLTPFNFFNDLYMRLVSLIAAGNEPVSEKIGKMAFLALYQTDKFREFILKFDLFSHLDLETERFNLILADSLEGQEARLKFGMDWMELIIFGQADNLKRKGA